MTPEVRRKWLIGAAVATLVAIVFAPPAEEDIAAPAAVQAGKLADAAPVGAAVPARNTARVETVLTILPRDLDETNPAAVLAPHAGTAPAVARKPAALPPPPVTVVAPPPPPVDEPPVLKVLGRYQAAGARAVLLQVGQDTLVVKKGDTVADLWRVEAIENERVTLVHRDTGRRHELSFEGK